MPTAQTQIQRAISQIKDSKGTIPEIDFTQHVLEDGSTISTQERVIKEVRLVWLRILFLNQF